MDWNKIYRNLISQAIIENRIKNTKIYYEKHHIIPKHMGGDNSKNNLVLLTFREHVLAHYLLWRIYKKAGDKLMWLIRSKQTEEAQRLRSKLATESLRKSGMNKTRWIGNKNPMKNPEKVQQAINTKKEKYNGHIISPEAREVWLINVTNHMQEMAKNPEIQAKRSKTIKEINKKLTTKELALKYNNRGENNSNYGWIKGYYEVIDPDGNINIYNSQAEIMKELNLSQSFLIRNRNKGICYTKPKKNTGQWNGWTFNYYKLPHPNTGKIQKKHKTHKHIKNT